MLFLVGLVVLCLIGIGAYFYLNNSSNGGITFSPSTVNCAAPVDFSSTLKLPSSVKADDVLTVKLDGKTESSLSVGSDSTISKQSDGRWSGVSTVSADDVQAACATGGVTSEGIGVLTPGTHTMQIVDAGGKVLASGSYTVTGQVGVTRPPIATLEASVPPTAPPSLASQITGSLTFTPNKVSCDLPVDFVMTMVLPSSVKAADSLTEMFDGKVINSFVVSDDATIIAQPDGSWLSTSTSPADTMITTCAAGGLNDSGVAVLTPGTHTVKMVDDNGKVLAQGSYTVLASAPTAAPSSTDIIYDGQIIFSPNNPKNGTMTCGVANQITSVSAKTSVYATYIFGSTADTNVLAIAITKNGKTYLKATNLPLSDSQGYDCFGDTTDLSKLSNWGPGTYHFTLTSDGDIIAVGDLTVK